MNNLGNPYKEPLPVVTRKVVADIGVEDWDHFHYALPFRGNQDQIISSLFHIFMRQLKLEQIPAHYDPDNHSRITSILGRITFLPPSRSGHSHTDRRAETGASQDHPRTSSLSSETPLGRSQDGEETFWKETQGY
jgi:hypothetical protein